MRFKSVLLVVLFLLTLELVLATEKLVSSQTIPVVQQMSHSLTA